LNFDNQILNSNFFLLNRTRKLILQNNSKNPDSKKWLCEKFSLNSLIEMKIPSR
jgi:hypothetical protein